jgi:diguanylate cyclase (GGDEF)-like protein
MNAASAVGKRARQIWTGSLQWCVGLFCSVWGAMVVVAPNDFRALGAVLLQPSPVIWGFVFFSAGGFLLVAASLSVRRWVHVTAHLFAGTVLLLMSAGFAAGGAVAGMLSYGILGIGTVVGAFLAEGRSAGSTGRLVDLFSVVLGVTAVLIGAALLALPNALGFGLMRLVRPVLPWYGLVCLGAGLVLTFINLRNFRAKVSFAVSAGAHLLLAAAFAGVSIIVVQSRDWTGAIYFAGFSLALALLPWVGPRMRKADPLSLRVRLAVTLAAAVALPIIVVVTLATAQAQRLVLRDELDAQRSAAAALATSIADYVNLHRAAVEALAAHPGLGAMKPAEQTALLAAFAGSYGDTVSFTIYDSQGRPQARTDALPPPPGDRIPVFIAVRGTMTPEMVVGPSPLTGRSELMIGAPVRDLSGFAGAVVASLPIPRLSETLFGPGLNVNDAVYLINEDGDVVAYRGPPQAKPPANIAQMPPVAAMISGKAQAGSLVFPSPSGDRLAGFAQVPGIWVCPAPCTVTIGWAVLLEKPASAALSGVDAERHLAFGLLLLAIVAAGIFGGLTGRAVARPLSGLAAAMAQYTSTGSEAPLPRSTTSEVGRLATAFGELRDRLTARTWERLQAEEALRRESSLLKLLQDAAIAANEAADAGEAFRTVLELICRSTGWSVGHVWLVTNGGESLEPTRIWYLDDPKRRHPFRQATEQMRLARGDGIPGRVLATGRPAWRTEMQNPSGPRYHAARESGLRGAVAIPVEAGGAVVAVMEFFSAEVRESDPMFLDTVATAGTQVGRVLEREQRNREAALLNELAELLQTSMAVGEAYTVIEQSGQKCFPEAGGILFLTGPSRVQLEPVCSWGASQEPGPFAPEECWALRRGQPHFSERAAGVACAHLSGGPGTSLCLPILAQNESLGLLQLRWNEEAGTTGPRPSIWGMRERLAVALARQIGPAIASLRLRESLRAQSIRDPLTGLFNRRYMEESLEREVDRSARRSSGMAVMMLDLDHFKYFNDAYGHEAGDAMLSAFGAFLLAHTRKEDIVCRYGGEEFVLILSDVTHRGAQERAEKLCRAAEDVHIQHRGERLGSITVSVGVAVFPTHGTTGKALLRAADEALYRAKQKGRARVEVRLAAETAET